MGVCTRRIFCYVTIRCLKPGMPYRHLNHPSRTRTFSFSAALADAKLPRAPLFEALHQQDPERTAIVHSQSGRSFTYGSLIRDIAERKERLHTHLGGNLESTSVSFLVENSYDYVVTLFSLLASSARAVPLSASFPASELKYFVQQSESTALLSTSRFDGLAVDVVTGTADSHVRHLHIGKLLTGSASNDGVQFAELPKSTSPGGLILYTSGTTARPKGVLLDHDVLLAQARSLIEAWKYAPNDRFLHFLPLHHIHGIVNAVIAPLLAGSTVEFAFPFNPDHVWRRLAAPFVSQSDEAERKVPVTVLTAVPTIWSRLLQTYPTLPEEIKTAGKEAIRRQNLRLNISGSAALPVPVKKAWTDISDGNVLLERYGMTEVGMALSCGLENEDRIDGSVGWPLPSVEVRLVDSETKEIIPEVLETEQDGVEHPGEIQLRGSTIFKGYWADDEATKKEFTTDGWFKTGDIAVRRSIARQGSGESDALKKGPAYFILGRESADIIKMGGEKVSALEVERELLSLPEVQECAVVALPSHTWGQKVAAVIVLSETGKNGGREGKPWSAMDMRRALKSKLAIHKIPQVAKIVGQIPRNAMGKVNKKQLVMSMFGDQMASATNSDTAKGDG